jgi:hypothetical protein
MALTTKSQTFKFKNYSVEDRLAQSHVLAARGRFLFLSASKPGYKSGILDEKYITSQAFDGTEK